MEKIHRLFCVIVMVLVVPFKPSTWRFVFRRECKVRVHLSNGRHIDVYCEKWSAKFGGPNGDGCSHYKFEGLRKKVTFDISTIIAMEER